MIRIGLACPAGRLALLSSAIQNWRMNLPPGVPGRVLAISISGVRMLVVRGASARGSASDMGNLPVRRVTESRRLGFLSVSLSSNMFDRQGGRAAKSRRWRGFAEGAQECSDGSTRDWDSVHET